MEGLKVSKANMVVYVHPSKSANITDAVLSELSTLLFTYSERFDGVVLAYGIDKLNKNVKITNGLHPYLRVKLIASLLLFSPKPNMPIEGKVAKVTQGSIHVIVHGFASAVIEVQDVRTEFEYRIKHGEERFMSKFDRRHVLKVGNVVRFLVKSFDEEILHISGSLIPDNTGSMDWLAKNPKVDIISDRSEFKRSIEHDSVIQNTGIISGESLSVNPEHRTKKSKKSKRFREEC